MTPRVLVTAHRGSSRAAPENTLAAIRRAIEDGADCCEIDVQELKDGAIVLLHDPDLRRVAGLDRPVGDLTAADVRDIDVGSWFDPAFRAERIPTLEQVIDLVRGRMRLDIELKHHGNERDLEGSVVSIVRRARFEDRCVITSLDVDSLRRVREVGPGLRVGPVVESESARSGEFDLVSLHRELATPERIRADRDAGRQVWVWTVNDEEEMRALVALGVDAVITDDPKLLRAVVDAVSN